MRGGSSSSPPKPLSSSCCCSASYSNASGSRGRMSPAPWACRDSPKAWDSFRYLGLFLDSPYKLKEQKSLRAVLYDLVTRAAITWVEGVLARVREIVRHFCPHLVGLPTLVAPFSKLLDVRNAVRVSAHADVCLGEDQGAIRIFIDLLMAHRRQQAAWESPMDQHLRASVGDAGLDVTPRAAWRQEDLEADPPSLILVKKKARDQRAGKRKRVPIALCNFRNLFFRMRSRRRRS